ncbi:MAG TPA: hypothetical protein VM031_04200 [Phycisphaerae bacterium]|nr:hypothetical protein [Phycisphaerae bacterium]
MAKEYNIIRTAGRCSACDRQMQPEEEFVATVRPGESDDDEQFLREDFCLSCWQAAGEEGREPSGRLGTWRSRMPAPREKPKRTFVDDELLLEFFRRLEGADEPARVQLRFVLALILMRKKLLVYDGSHAAGDGRDVWSLHLRGETETCKVVDPHMDDEKIAEVSRQLGDVLEGEL